MSNRIDSKVQSLKKRCALIPEGLAMSGDKVEGKTLKSKFIHDIKDISNKKWDLKRFD